MGLPGWVASGSLGLCYSFQRSCKSTEPHLAVPHRSQEASIYLLVMGPFWPPQRGVLLNDFAFLDAAVMAPGTLKVFLVLDEMGYEG